ncbi:MAG TPA: alpha/beta hydrolase [Chthoniobacteraceae bacterium]|jgi:acetyl esterase/lipase|nr:alpha/beta hydrolase [Chthoniobacteraceae bacterium]
MLYERFFPAALLTLFAAASLACAQSATPLPAASPAANSPAVVDVWPQGKMPGHGATGPETVLPARDGFHRVTNVSVPTLTIFAAPNAGGAAPAMIICPGGGYSYTVVDKEGSEIAAWLNANGITGLVLKYRAPHNRDGAMQDVQRALSLTRAHAAEWKIDPKRLGVIGFSAGGNLAAKASTQFDARTYPPIDDVDQQSCRPDFAILVYPAYLEDGHGHLSADLNVKANIPPTLIIHNEDDHAFVPGSKLYNAALDQTKVVHEFKCYPTGGHGYGLHCTKDAKVWPQDAIEWLRKTGIL